MIHGLGNSFFPTRILPSVLEEPSDSEGLPASKGSGIPGGYYVAAIWFHLEPRKRSIIGLGCQAAKMMLDVGETSGKEG